MSRKLKKFLVSLGIVIIVIFLLVSFTPFNNWLTWPLKVNEKPERADVIIILGSGVRRNGELPKKAKERVLKGMELFFRGYGDKILVSSGFHKPSGFVESKKMAEFLEEKGIDEKDIIQEDRSTNTYENAMESIRVMEKNNFQDAILVTSDFHSKRSCLCFRKQGADVICVSADKDYLPQTYFDRFIRFKNIIREYGAMIYFKLRGYI